MAYAVFSYKIPITAKGLFMKKLSLLALIVASLPISAYAADADQHRHEIAADKGTIAEDKQELRRDKREVRQDKRELRREHGHPGRHDHTVQAAPAAGQLEEKAQDDVVK